MFRAFVTAGISLVGAGLISAPPPPMSNIEVRALLLTGAEVLVDGPALINGGSGLPVVSQGYADAFNSLYLHAAGFNASSSDLLEQPNSLYPFVPPGPFAETLNPSMATAQQVIGDAIHDHIGGPDHPVLVTGYSQSAVADSLLMPQLVKDGVDPQDVHFVMLGDEMAPNGGMLERFDLVGNQPTVPSLGITFSGAGDPNLYPADVYTYEYDGFADFPKYPIDFLSDLNAYLGILTNHVAYLGLTRDQVDNAIPLPVSHADTMVAYHMIESPSLPLLDLVRLVPFVGNPMADLIQPDLSVLVDLGYGSTTQGWSPGDADVATPLGFLPPQSVLEQVPDALRNGVGQGLHDAFKDLTTASNYQLISPETMHDFLGPLLRSAVAALNLDGSPSEVFSYLSAELGGLLKDYATGLGQLSLTHTGIPPIDMASAALFTLPKIDAEMFAFEWANGNYLDAFGDPLAADIGIAPLMLIGALGL